jgi:dipeptidyl-peptidase-4
LNTKRLGRRVLSVVTGILVGAVPAVATDLALVVAGIFPVVGKAPVPDHLLLIATAYRAAYGILGGYATARLAPDRPMRHVLVLGVLGTLVGIAGTVATWNAGPAFDPKWYPIVLSIIAIPTAWIGGKLAESRAPATGLLLWLAVAPGIGCLAADTPKPAQAGAYSAEAPMPQRVTTRDEAVKDAARPPPLSPTLTLDRLFSAREFDAEDVPPIRWSRRSSTYFTLSESPSGQGRDLVRTDPATGKQEIVVPAAAFVPEEGAGALAVEAFELSDDESKLLVFTNSRKVWRRNTRGDYWVLDVASRTLRKLGGDAEPATLMFARFSPDGSRVAYVRQGNLYVQEVRGLRITALTTDGSATLTNGTSDWVNEEELNLRDCFRWSPDGKRLLFWQFDTSGVGTFHLLNNTDGTYPRITSFAYPKVGGTNSATRLGVVSVRSGKVRWLHLPGDPREHYIPHAEWTPDGAQVLIQQFNRLQTENRVMLADRRTGVTRLVMTETDSAWLENENPVRWASPGKELLWLSERSGWRHAYRASLDGKEFTPVTEGEFDVMDIESVDSAGGWLYFAASPENATQRYLYRTRLDGRGGPPQRVSPTAQPGWHEYDIAPDAKWAIHRYSTFTTPPVVELVRLPGHSVVRVLADNNKLRERLDALKRPGARFLRVRIGGGVTLDGWCLKPPGMDRSHKYPLLVHVYGEPQGQTVKDAWAGPRGLWHWMLAQQGCVVVSVDNRGTNVPRGRDWRKSVHRKIGILAPQEQARAVRALLARWSFVDPARVAVWGWSGGGSMSLNAIFRYPYLYRTAIAVAPNADQRLYDTIYQERYMGLPEDNAEGYRDGSPLTHAHQLRGNLLLVHGTGDDNGHYQGTERLLNELIARGKRFTVMPYPNRSHSISEGPNTIRHFWGELTRYLDDNLISADPPEPDAETRTIRGWTLHINRALLATEPELTERAVALLDRQLEEITRVVPRKSVAALREVPLYFSPEYPGVGPRAEYHPDAGWLFDHGRDPAMAHGIEFSNIRIFEPEMSRMPNFALHELAHAYQHRVLPRGFGNSELRAAHARAKKSGTYDRVERHHGDSKPITFERAYALTSPVEYFAESSEAFFSRNDFFPFTRDELKRHDAAMFDLLEKLWNQP